ncbi:MAG: Fur family transcriptional regulator [Halanaerobiaceae bacterium]
MAEIEAWEEKIKQFGIKCTEQRRVILTVLLEADRPLSAGEIAERSEIRLSTVYRNLNLFVEKKLVSKFHLDKDGLENRFEISRGEHHHHLICQDCGEIVPLSCPLRGLAEKIGRRQNYRITGHSLNIYGLCSRCRK